MPTVPVNGSEPLMVSTALAATVTVTVIVYSPAVVGVPESVRVAVDVPDAVMPGGRFCTDHIYVPVPFETVSVEL